MPYQDGTGPTGTGPRTGRGAGNCAGQAGVGRFGGRGGRGLGLGRGFGFAQPQDSSWLEQQIQSLQSALQSITERLDALKKQDH